MAWWVWLVIGLFLGANFGVIIISLCVAASREKYNRQYYKNWRSPD
jgi:hypothetical protein